MDNTADSDTVELVFSGIKFRGISKSLLILHSEYFRALFDGNFSDSQSNYFTFEDLSATGFSFLLRYLKTQTVNLQRKEFRTIENAIFIADHLCIDSFSRDLQKTLLSAPADVDPQLALDLLKLLKVDIQEFANKCCQEFQLYCNSPREISANTQEKVFNNDFMTLATSRDEFWKIERSYYCYDFFWKMTNRIEKVLLIAMQNKCHLQKIRDLLKNVNLECVPWNSLKMLLYHLPGEKNRVVMLGVQHHFSDLRIEIGNKVSAIRVCYKLENKKTTSFGILEFDLDKWTWVQQKEATKNFQGKFCVMARDWTNVFGDSGLMIFRMRDRDPKIVDNLYIGEMCRWLDSYYPHVATCVLGRCIYIFLYHPHPESHVVNHLADCRWYSRPTLFKLDVFDKNFNDCAWFPVVAATMVAEANMVYIAGFSPGFKRLIKIFSYHTISGRTRKIVEIQTTREVGLPQLHLALINNLLYVFYQQNYWIVDVKSTLDQSVPETSLECFFTQGWSFTILQLCVVEGGIIFLLDISHTAHNCDYLGMLLAFLNTETKKFRSLGFLPNPVEEYRYRFLINSMQVQIERRTPSSNALLQTKGFVEGIVDLENVPHKHSSSYY